MEFAGYVLAALIGISLGLIGGGGSIVTVPLLVYVLGISPVIATSYSLFIVGTTSLVGAFNNWRRGLVQIKTALLFGASSILTVFLTRKLLIPIIPKQIARFGNFVLTESMLTMLLFALLMLLAAAAMIKSSNSVAQAEPDPTVPTAVTGNNRNFLKLLLYGIGIGLATGLLGAGGGFLLIPTLVLLLRLPMKQAVGTSLLIIALNSLIGFTGDLGHFAMDWFFLLKITLLAIGGIFIGGYLARKINGAKLKKGFGWFVLIVGFFIIIKELFYAGGSQP